MTDKTERIRALNDELRTTGKGGKVFYTAGLSALPHIEIIQIAFAVARFNSFTPDNDPHNEHDFDKVTVAGHDVFFKIDYYDENMEYGSEDPADPARTTRVMTVMLAEEY